MGTKKNSEQKTVALVLIELALGECPELWHDSESNAYCVIQP